MEADTVTAGIAGLFKERTQKQTQEKQTDTKTEKRGKVKKWN